MGEGSKTKSAANAGVLGAIAVAVLVLAVGGGLSVRRIVDEGALAERARMSAELERKRAEERGHELLLERARLLLSRDPPAAMAALLELPSSGAGWATARFIAEEARDLGVPETVERYSRQDQPTDFLSSDRAVFFTWKGDRIWSWQEGQSEPHPVEPAIPGHLLAVDAAGARFLVWAQGQQFLFEGEKSQPLPDGMDEPARFAGRWLFRSTSEYKLERRDLDRGASEILTQRYTDWSPIDGGGAIFVVPLAIEGPGALRGQIVRWEEGKSTVLGTHDAGLRPILRGNGAAFWRENGKLRAAGSVPPLATLPPLDPGKTRVLERSGLWAFLDGRKLWIRDASGQALAPLDLPRRIVRAALLDAHTLAAGSFEGLHLLGLDGNEPVLLHHQDMTDWAAMGDELLTVGGSEMRRWRRPSPSVRAQDERLEGGTGPLFVSQNNTRMRRWTGGLRNPEEVQLTEVLAAPEHKTGARKAKSLWQTSDEGWAAFADNEGVIRYNRPGESSWHQGVRLPDPNAFFEFLDGTTLLALGLPHPGAATSMQSFFGRVDDRSLTPWVLPADQEKQTLLGLHRCRESKLLVAGDLVFDAPGGPSRKLNVPSMRGHGLVCGSGPGELLLETDPRPDEEGTEIWRVTTAGKLDKLLALPLPSTLLAAAPNVVAAALKDKRVLVEFLDTHRRLVRLAGPASLAWMRLAPDGTRLLTYDNWGTLRLWNFATGANEILEESAIDALFPGASDRVVISTGDRLRMLHDDLPLPGPALVEWVHSHPQTFGAPER